MSRCGCPQPPVEYVKMRVREEIASYTEMMAILKAYIDKQLENVLTLDSLRCSYTGDGDIVTDVKYDPETGIFTVEKNAQTADDEEMDDLLGEEFGGDDGDDEPDGGDDGDEPDDGDGNDGGEQP